MRNIWRIFHDDARFIVSNIISMLVVVGLGFVPALYAWFNIAGSWDPYGNTNQLKVAVANSDDGYESVLMPVELNIGDRVASMLREDDDYDWVFTGEEDAVDGVRSGEYYAAIVIPGDFSERMMSVLSTDAEQASVDYYLNMKENPIAPVLAGEGEAEVMEDIRVRFTDAVDQMTLGLAADLVSYEGSGNSKDFGARLVARLGTVADGLDTVADQVRAFSGVVDATSELASASAKALSGPDKPDAAAPGSAASDSSSTSGSGSSESSEGTIDIAVEALDAAISSAQSAASDIERQVEFANSSNNLNGVGTEVAARLAEDVSTLATSIDSLSSKADKVTSSLEDVIASLTGSTDSVASNLDDVWNNLGVAANKLGMSASKVRKFQDDVASALSRGDLSTVASIVGGNEAALAKWLADPVQVDKHAVYPVENYGSSMAPFYTILSIWVGAVMLVALMRTGLSEKRLRRYEQETSRPVRNFEQYLGRYLIFMLLNLAQATVVCLGDLFFLQVQCVHPLLFLVACWVCAIVFSSIVYTFAVSFGEIGKALCIIMLVMQVAGSGGEYPIQMMGGFFQAVYPFLPFTHGMHAMQAAIAGVYGSEYVMSLLLLCAFLVPTLLLGLAIRRPVIRFMEFFDGKLKETGLM